MLKTNLTKIIILKKLIESAGELVSSGKLSKEVNISRQSIWKAIESLREEGFHIDSIRNRGYRICMNGHYDLAPTWIAVNTPTHETWGQEVYVLDSMDSTQIMGKELARKNCSNGTIVLCEEQTLGRGRMKRQWNSPPKTNIYMSIISFPEMNPSMLQLINLAAGLSVLGAMKDVTGLDCQLKWPNDILYDGKKLCGILSEASIESDMIHFVVTGIGINVNADVSSYSEELKEKATSLLHLRGSETDRGVLTAKIISDFHIEMADLERDGPEELLKRYRKNCSTLGKSVEIITDHKIFSGTAVDITSRGEIVVEDKSKKMVFSAADIIHAPHK